MSVFFICLSQLDICLRAPVAVSCKISSLDYWIPFLDSPLLDIYHFTDDVLIGSFPWHLKGLKRGKGWAGKIVISTLLVFFVLWKFDSAYLLIVSNVFKLLTTLTDWHKLKLVTTKVIIFALLLLNRSVLILCDHLFVIGFICNNDGPGTSLLKLPCYKC